MLNSIGQVNEEFFRIFQGVKITMGGAEKSVLCRYARKSSKDYAEEQKQQHYPCISIQDYSPTPKEEWYIDMHQYVGDISADGLTAFLYERPIWLDFKYDVSIAAKSYHEYMALQDYFMGHFVYGKRFLFNKKLSGFDEVGDVVPYEVIGSYIPRNDGIFETNYEFSCSVWLYPRSPQEVEVIQELVLTARPTNTYLD